MNFRDIITNLAASNRIELVEAAVSKEFQAAQLIQRLDPKPVLFQNIDGWRLASNILTSREWLIEFLNLDPAAFLRSFHTRLSQSAHLTTTTEAPCQEVRYEPPNLLELPILRHYAIDGSNYITAGVWVVHDPDYGRNLSYHRMMVTSDRTGSVRVVEGRGMDHALKRGGAGTPVAICIGAPVHVMLAAALSPSFEVDEMELAARFAPVSLVKCVTNDLMVPAETEIVIEARLTNTCAAEGPFVDITGTKDFVRTQPVFEVTAITSRKNPVYHALLPASAEHRTLMGLPKEYDIFVAVSRICRCSDVVLTRGGNCWLHAAIAIDKTKPGDPREVIHAAFKAHKSLKHCVIVDSDINIHDHEELEWAIATRLQAYSDAIILADQPSSSLDPSALHAPGRKSTGSKMGLNATIKLREGEDISLYKRVV